jgi:hypothetical protein
MTEDPRKLDPGETPASVRVAMRTAKAQPT